MNEDYTIELTGSIMDQNVDDWNSVLQDQNVYLSIDYLKSIELSLKDEMQFFYALVKDEADQLVMIQYFQLVEFIDNRKSIGRSIFKNLHGQFKSEKGFSVNILVCGNVFSDGENGLLMASHLDPKVGVRMAGAIADSIVSSNFQTKKTGIIIFKEYWPSSTSHMNHLQKADYQDFMIDVNMVLNIHPDWQNMGDYLASMKTKYRTRANSIFSKSKELEIRTLSSDEIAIQSEIIEALFHNVQSKSEYLMGRIKAKSFELLSSHLSSKFKLRGVFLTDELIGFSTSFYNNDVLEANYVGIDYNYNKSHGVYQFLLYDYVEQAIISNSKELHLGRTSELVKSSLGAKPVDMKLYGKHRFKLANVFVSKALKSVSPSKFELRKPFKTKFIEEWTR